MGYADGASISDLMRRVGVGRPTIYKCIDKALTAGVMWSRKTVTQLRRIGNVAIFLKFIRTNVPQHTNASDYG